MQNVCALFLPFPTFSPLPITPAYCLPPFLFYLFLTSNFLVAIYISIIQLWSLDLKFFGNQFSDSKINNLIWLYNYCPMQTWNFLSTDSFPNYYFWPNEISNHYNTFFFLKYHLKRYNCMRHFVFEDVIIKIFSEISMSLVRKLRYHYEQNI